jgi:hypothetical protein
MTATTETDQIGEDATDEELESLATSIESAVDRNLLAELQRIGERKRYEVVESDEFSGGSIEEMNNEIRDHITMKLRQHLEKTPSVPVVVGDDARDVVAETIAGVIDESDMMEPIRVTEEYLAEMGLPTEPEDASDADR